MAEGHHRKGHGGKDNDEGKHRRHRDPRREKREKFLDLLHQEGVPEDDPFKKLSDEKLLEISEAIGHKRPFRKEISPFQARIGLKLYYYKIKLEEVKQEFKAHRHSRKDEKTGVMLHEESSDASESADATNEKHGHFSEYSGNSKMNNEPGKQKGRNNPETKSYISGNMIVINNLGQKSDTKNMRENADEAAGKNHAVGNQYRGKGALYKHDSTESDIKNTQKYKSNAQQQTTRTNTLDHQHESSNLINFSVESESKNQTTVPNDVRKIETSAMAYNISETKNLEPDVTRVTGDQVLGAGKHSEKIGSPSANIVDIVSEDEIKTLSDRDLKTILSNATVNCIGLCERKDLLTLVQSLWEHHQETKRDGDISMRSECTICMNARIDCVFLECGHLVSCMKCGQAVKECPFCRNDITRAVHIFRP